MGAVRLCVLGKKEEGIMLGFRLEFDLLLGLR